MRAMMSERGDRQSNWGAGGFLCSSDYMLSDVGKGWGKEIKRDPILPASPCLPGCIERSKGKEGREKGEERWTNE